MVEALRYKLRYFGVPIDYPTEVLCDNKSVVTNSSVPASTLNKRHNAICYHRMREAQACGMIQVLWIEGKNNLADLFSKTTIAGDTMWNFVNQIFYKSDSVDED
ncbi:gag-pol polyprotein [Chaetoceros tenuissimus]|uniref:Gag-pol polyprotein n=1 Tax=Chaetoceros tenuissimus TaxID=426638 RepID=A0AAD3CRI1_9STRA|nr:gag-pol polyprotein [Chaetoceros tenuissimus]